MAKRLKILIILLSLLKLSAQAQLFSEINLKLHDHTPFTIVLDNQNYLNPSNSFVLKNLLPGRHFLQVARTVPSITGWTSPSSIYCFSGIINIPYNVSLFAYIDPDNAFNIINIYPLNCNTYGNSYTTYPNQPISPTPGWSHGSFNLQNEDSYKRLKSILAKTNLSKLKLDILKQAVTFNSIRSEQVSELMLFLDFDSERLELAKYAYYFTLDKENYFLINNSFIFSGSIMEINKHLYSYY